MPGVETRCRLCGGATTEHFRLRILGKHEVGFGRCERCGSLQTEPEPYWLEEAYADQRRFFDTGAVERNQHCQACAYWLRWAFRLAPDATVLDWGGGDGLFTRMLRDIGFDAYHSDRYATNTYAAGFDDAPGREYDLVTAFEVYEHLPNPADTMAELFARRPKVHFICTGLYHGQNADWMYISPSTGRHVFFFSEQAMRWIADTHGYDVLIVGDYTVFHRIPLAGFRRFVLTGVLANRGRRLFRALFAARRSQFGRAEADRTLLMRRRGLLPSD